MSFAIAISEEQWEFVADLFDPPGRRGAPAQIPRRQMVDAILFIGRTGCQWRYLPERYGSWTAVWAQWRRWRANGVWARAMARLAAIIRVFHEREPLPSMVMVDAQTVKGGRYGPTFHQAGGRGGRTIGTKRTLLVEILGLPVAAHAGSARPHDVAAARELLHDRLDDLPRVRAIVGDRAYRGLAKLAGRKHVTLDVKAPPKGTSGFVPIRPLYKIEHAFAQLGRWRRLSRCYEGTEASARACPENPDPAYRLGRLFAVLERAQDWASPGLNATIRDRYYAAASTTPLAVFPRLLALKNHHVEKIESAGRRIWVERTIGEIVDGIPAISAHLALTAQGAFAVGYYHQRQSFFNSKAESVEALGGGN